MKEKTHYAALIVDVIESRKYKERFVIQSYIKTAVKICNQLFHEELCKPVMFSAGDELQGLFYSAQGAYRYYAFFTRLAYPIQVRCGIGVGELDFFADWISTELDGPAYHRAREAIAHCHTGEGQHCIVHAERASDTFVNGLIGSYLLLLEALKPKTTILYTYAEFLDSFLVPQWQDLVTDLTAIKSHLAQQQVLCTDTIPSYKPSFSLSLDEQCFEEPDVQEFGALVTKSWKRGLNGRIAKALGIRRQYVDSVVRKNNFSHLRYIEALIVETLREVQ